MNTILTLVGYYLPGFKGGGPIQAIANLVQRLEDRVNFKIITRDRDQDDTHPYPSVSSQVWQQVGAAQVSYLPPGFASILKLYRILVTTKYEVLYLNSFFSFVFTVFPLVLYKLKLIKPQRLILAPRGELSHGALCLKAFKKKCFIRLVKFIGLYHAVIWQASSAYEAEDVKKAFGTKIKIVVASELLPIQQAHFVQKRLAPKNVGQLKIVFLSRISPKKNLLYALQTLANLSGPISFDIYGPIQDDDYWKQCRLQIEKLPSSVKVNYQGEIRHSEVLNVLSQYDLFFLPTLSENYGYVIVEALLAGCPVLLSDQTPWGDIEEHLVGHCINLNNFQGFIEILQKWIDMDEATHARYRENAHQYAVLKSQAPQDLAKNVALFC